MLRFFLLLIFIFLKLTSIATVDSPKFTCLSYSSGSADMTWLPVTDSNSEFQNYHLYFSNTRGGPYSLIISYTDINQTFHAHNTVLFLLPETYYYIQTEYKENNIIRLAPTSDTLQLIKALVSNEMVNGSPTGRASVTWNPLTYNIPAFQPTAYLFQKNLDGDPWALTDSVPIETQQYTYSIKVCEDSMYFRIEWIDTNGCTSASFPRGGLLSDNSKPEPVLFDSVSVDLATGQVIMGWQPGPSLDIGGYIINKVVGNNVVQDTIYGINNTTYIDFLANPSSIAEEYYVVPFDTCVTGNPPFPNVGAGHTPHKTMLLQLTPDNCSTSIDLSWNAYEGWNTGIAKYGIYVSTNSGPYTLVTEVSNTTTSYNHGGLTEGTNYCYFIRALDGSQSKTSSSNQSCGAIYQPILPVNHYLNQVTVNSDDLIEIRAFVDPNAEVASYLIKRSSSLTIGYEIIETIPNTGLSNITYIDPSADPNSLIYYYQIVAVDICGNEMMVSNLGNNIRLFTTGNSNELTVNLNWGNYFGWDTLSSGVSYFNIYRSIDGVYDTKPIALIGNDEFIYIDNVAEYNRSNGEFCYYIEAIEGSDNLLGFKENSLSNKVCSRINSSDWIPSAFTPDDNGVNDIFFPVLNFIDITEYQFSVYNRWGNKLFYTTDIDQGWDGLGHKTGVYVYFISFKDSDKQVHQKREAFMLLK